MVSSLRFIHSELDSDPGAGPVRLWLSSPPFHLPKPNLIATMIKDDEGMHHSVILQVWGWACDGHVSKQVLTSTGSDPMIRPKTLSSSYPLPLPLSLYTVSKERAWISYLATGAR